MLHRVVIPLVLVMGFAAPVIAQSQISAADLQADLKLFNTQLPEKHVDLFHRLPKEDFLAQVVTLEQDLGSLDANAFLLRLNKILSAVGDGHTTALPSSVAEQEYFPINFKVLDDGVYVRAIEQSHSDEFGAKLVAIGSLPARDVIARLSLLFPHDNPSGFNSILDNQMNHAMALRFIGAASKTGLTEFHFSHRGQPSTVQLEAVEAGDVGNIRWEAGNLSLARYQRKAQFDCWNDWIAESNTLYFKYNRCRNAPAFNKLVRGTVGFIQQNQVERFVLDLRDNGGGDSRIFQPLLDYLRSSEFNVPGKLFVIVGRRTFSSAILNAIQMKQQTKAVLVGEPTGGKPNHFGEVRSFNLPNTKIRIQYSTKQFQMMPGSDADSLQPDVVVELNSADWFSGSDPFLQAALDYEPK